MSVPEGTPPAGGPADRLEQRYRRLLAWYPEPFRSQREDEMLAVLLASARPGQQRPALADSADVIRSALGMRLRLLRAGPARHDRADALAAFAVLGPLFLVVVSLLEVALPYHVPASAVHVWRLHYTVTGPSSHLQIGGLRMITHNPLGFDVALGVQVIIAALVLAGRRRPALAAIALWTGYWIYARDVIPQPIQVLSAGIYMLTVAALIAAPDLRRGRRLVTWRHAVVLLLAAAAVQASTLSFDQAVPFTLPGLPDNPVFLIVAVGASVLAATAAAAARLNWYLAALLAAALYPWVVRAGSRVGGAPTGLLWVFWPGHLVLIFGPPLVLACGAVLADFLHRGDSGSGEPAAPDQPRPA
jgi:hypothetical protein